jgi:hypothetical protein
MQVLTVESFRDLMQYGDCTIKCLYSGEVVRTLTVVGESCHLLAGDGTELDIPLDTPITYQPWCMDRGNMLFSLGGQLLSCTTRCKICTEGDVLIADSGEYSVEPPR